MAAHKIKYAIALYRSKIEFYEKKLDTVWSLYERIDTEDLNADQISEEFRARADILKEKTKNITLWLSQNICKRYSSKTEMSAEELTENFFNEDEIDSDDAVLFSVENSVKDKKNRYEYLVIEKPFWEEATQFIAAFGFKIENVARAPKSSTFPMPKEFALDTMAELKSPHLDKPTDAPDDAPQEENSAKESGEESASKDAPKEASEQSAQETSEKEKPTEDETKEKAKPAATNANDQPDLFDQGEKPTAEKPTAAKKAAKISEKPQKNQKETTAKSEPKKAKTYKRFWPVLAIALVLIAVLIGIQLGSDFWRSGGETSQPPAQDQAATETETASVETSAPETVDATVETIVETEEDIPSRPENHEAVVEEIIAEDAKGLNAPPPRDEEKIAAIKKRIDAQTKISGSDSGDGVNLENLILLGIFGSTGKPQAMIRSPNGNVYTVKKGSNVDGWSVVAISREEVVVSKGTNQMRLKVPN